jgi:thymidylate synthase (FAD)
MIEIQEETTKNPITLIGKEAGICWGADIEDNKKNYRRGIDCIQNDHGRTLEFPQVYITIEDYSARVMRELYTHIGGAPTRLQASTRYIDYTDFSKKQQFVIPDSVIKEGGDALSIYVDTMDTIGDAMIKLNDLGIPREDIALLLTLGMYSKMVWRTNLRNLIDMSHQRLCNRANWEFRRLFTDIMDALKNYSEEWREIVVNNFKPKCQYLGYCPEKHSCGAHKKTRFEEIIYQLENEGYKIIAPDDGK